MSEEEASGTHQVIIEEDGTRKEKEKDIAMNTNEEQTSDGDSINKSSSDKVEGGDTVTQRCVDSTSCKITEQAEEVIEAQHLSESRGSSKVSETDRNKTSHDKPQSSPVLGKVRHSESFTETYDVITRKEVQSLTEWESIHKECLSEIPPIDPGALHDLESRANDVASNLDHLLGTLAASLKSMSVIGVQSADAYRTSLENLEETVDLSIKSMYTLIARCEELNSHMGPLYTIAAQIKEIKRTLDTFESMCK